LKPIVLQLIDSFNQGGSERQALQLVRLLFESGRYDVRVASLSPEGSLRGTIGDLNIGDIPSFPLRSFYHPSTISQLSRLVRWLKSNRVSIIHTHDFYTNIFGMTAGRLGFIPARIASKRETVGMRTTAQLKLQKTAFSLASQIVANSVAVKKSLIDEGVPSQKIEVVYNGLDINRVAFRSDRKEALQKLKLPADDETPRRFVSIVANMRLEVKDYPMFLRAAKKVAATIPNVAFLLAGEGPLSDSLKMLAGDLGILGSTFFLGRCDDLSGLLGISEVCVLSSKAEGFSNSILEYMAAGRPVVATNVGGASEVIVEGETGFLVAAGDDHMMAERLISLLADADAARQMGEKGKAIVIDQFSCEAQLMKTESLYDRLLQLR